MADITSLENQNKGTTAPGVQRLAYTLEDAGELLGGLSRNSFYRLNAAGKLRLIKVGGRTLVPHSEIVRLLGGDGEAA
ncbi:helix-turn-helix domain-containing protein [Daeguia caeni]|uniref:Helix-turn-helix domain-containing protein n=1 Tax=Daeguia caeni TaxID=439612 RepID=A0ABV9H780_9HYPH